AELVVNVYSSDTNKTDGCRELLRGFSMHRENIPENRKSSERFKLLLLFIFSVWCPWPESNQHSLRNSILSRARLPVPPQGPSVAGRRAGAAKRAAYSGRPARGNPRGWGCGVPRQGGGGRVGRCCLFEQDL